jgi:UDP-N-acetylglucosamine acyltransferase
MYRLLYRSNLNTQQAVEAIIEQIADSPERQIILDFIRNSKRGLSKGPYHLRKHKSIPLAMNWFEIKMCDYIKSFIMVR